VAPGRVDAGPARLGPGEKNSCSAIKLPLVFASRQVPPRAQLIHAAHQLEHRAMNRHPQALCPHAKGHSSRIFADGHFLRTIAANANLAANRGSVSRPVARPRARPQKKNACLQLNKLGYDLELSEPDNAGRNCIRCKRTGNRFALEPVNGQE
jgi:hypothetical protein